MWSVRILQPLTIQVTLTRSPQRKQGSSRRDDNVSPMCFVQKKTTHLQREMCGFAMRRLDQLKAFACS